MLMGGNAFIVCTNTNLVGRNLIKMDRNSIMPDRNTVLVGTIPHNGRYKALLLHLNTHFCRYNPLCV